MNTKEKQKNKKKQNGLERRATNYKIANYNNDEEKIYLTWNVNIHFLKIIIIIIVVK